VLTYLDREHLSDPAFNLPIVNATPEHLDDVLAILVSTPELRQRLGTASREAVVRFQSIGALAEVWDRIYRFVWCGTPPDLGRTAHFNAERGTRSFVEDPAAEEFWPVPVRDLLHQIRTSLQFK
jgi:hypothetical protein